MISEETINGYWFMPDNDQIRFYGKLTFGPQQSPRLVLIATHTHDLSGFPFEESDYTIWGYSTGGEAITLFQCNRLTIQSAGGSVQTADFNAHDIVFSGHISAPDDPVFDAVRFSFAGMENWMGVFGQEIEFDDHDLNSYRLSIHRPKDIPFKVSDEVSGAWSFWTARPYVKSRDIQLQQDNLFKLEFRSSRSLVAIHEEIRSFQMLYTLFSFKQTWVRWAYLGYEGKELRLFYRQGTVKTDEPDGFVPLIRYPFIVNTFENAISKWTEIRPGLQQIMAILHANIGESDQYVHNNFLNIVQAVEAYHRRILQDTEALKAANDPRVARILAGVDDPEDRAWLEGRLSFSHEPNLATRLKELLNIHSATLFEDIPSKTRLNKLIRRIVDKRNYFTHYDVSLENQEEETVVLINLTRFLTLLLSYCLLYEIGYDYTFLKDKIYRRYRFNLSTK
jgi:hypothetical protein